MKKIACLLVLGLMLESIPSRTIASVAPPSGSATGFAGLALVGLVTYLVITGDDAAAHKPSAKATGNEFQDLNNNPAFKSLLKQQAGGSLNTLEILK